MVFVLMVCGLLADVHAQLRSRVHASGFEAPLAFIQDPADRAVQFVVQQGGRIRVVRNGVVLPGDFLDLTSAISSGGERGVLGLAFAPDAASGRFFVNFTNPSGDTKAPLPPLLNRTADCCRFLSQVSLGSKS